MPNSPHGTPPIIDPLVLQGDASVSREAYDALWRQLYQYYDPEIKETLRRKGLQVDVVREVCSMVWHRAQAYAGTLKAMGSFGGWLQAITANSLATVQRRRMLEDEQLQEIPESLASAEPDPLRRIEAQELLDRVLLDLTRSEALFIRLVAEGYSHPEIADRLGISLSASKTRLHRIRSRFEEMLSGLDAGFIHDSKGGYNEP